MPSSDANRTGTRLPRYTGERPLEARTQGIDQSALHIAKLALLAKQRRRRKSVEKTTEATEDEVEHKTKAEQDAGAGTSETHDNMASSSWEPQHQVFGDVPKVRLPLRSMYDGTGDWPKKVATGGTQYSWSGTGFPHDKFLVVGSYEDDTHIDTTEVSVMELAKDIANVRQGSAENIVDGPVYRYEGNSRIIESFSAHTRTVCRIKFEDVDALADGSPYSASNVSKSVEQKISNAVGDQPELKIEQWVTAHVLLSMAGQIGGGPTTTGGKLVVWLNSSFTSTRASVTKSGDRWRSPRK